MVLATSGVQTEVHLPFAGLHQLLLPLLGKLATLPGPQRAALEAAFGMNGNAAPDLFLIALATLDLLAEAAGTAPLLVLADDAHWLDRSTSEVLTFVARRVSLEPIVILIAIRDGSNSPFESASLAELRLGALEPAAASELLASHAPQLASDVRARLLKDAAGNPLALIELPAAFESRDWRGATLPDHLPLSARLERAFAARSSELPFATRALLLVSAADESVSLAEVLRTAALVVGTAVEPGALEPAISTRLLEVEKDRIRFSHPLVRSAIYQAASVPERQAVHAALSRVVANGDQGVWHRAAAAIGIDDDVALALDGVADRARRRGALGTSMAALVRAAELGGDRKLVAVRRLRAAESAVDLGSMDVVARLLAQTDAMQLGPIEKGRLAWIREMSEPAPPGEPGRMRSLLETASRVADAGDADLALRLLYAAAVSGFWADRENELSEEIVELAEGMPVSDVHPWLLTVLAYGAPIDRGTVVIDRVSRLVPDSERPDDMSRIAGAAASVGAFDLAETFAAAAVVGLRAQGRLSALVPALVLRAWSEIHIGRWHVATPDAEEAHRLAQETGQIIWGAGAQVALSLLAGLRSEEDAAEAFATDAERVGLQFGARAVLSVVQFARGLTALGAGRHEEAYVQLRRMFVPTDPAYHRMESCWAIGNLAEAAIHSGHEEEARAVMAELEPLAQRTSSTWLHVAMRHARALLAADEDADELFRVGLEANLSRWPFDRARLLLANGSWLRRQRRIGESRSPLRAARDGFDALGVVSWGERARQELRASGESSEGRAVEGHDHLSPQELQIARLAAQGLTNREIGQTLYLSHRTVGSHLYRVFPKLGISSRSQLAAALRADADVTV